MHKLQDMLGLPYTASVTIGGNENVWFVSEEASGPVVGDPKALELIKTNAKTKWLQKSTKLLKYKIDVNKWMYNMITRDIIR